jgi:DNA-3-methyladenine glycosylase
MLSSPPPLPRNFYDRDAARVARELLGKLLVRRLGGRLTVGRIVEAEAYLAAGDSASHSFRGQTPRNAVMFGPAGHAYVYAIHSRWCLNVVTEPAGTPSAVLVRAVEPLVGITAMQRRRGVESLRDLARGPARLCEAFAVDRALNGLDLTRGRTLWIAAAADAQGQDGEVIVTPRIGVTSAHDLPLRFALADSPFVSGRRKWPAIVVGGKSSAAQRSTPAGGV